MGIGLNTDAEVVSEISARRSEMDYTLIGDGVNVASRLESACEGYSARILISDNAYKLLRGTYRIRDVDQVIVKGKTEPVSVYEVLDYHTDRNVSSHDRCGELFQRGHRLLPQAQFRNRSSNSETLRRHPADKLSQTYIDAARFLIENPHDDWHGIWEMREIARSAISSQGSEDRLAKSTLLYHFV